MIVSSIAVIVPCSTEMKEYDFTSETSVSACMLIHDTDPSTSNAICWIRDQVKWADIESDNYELLPHSLSSLPRCSSIDVKTALTKMIQEIVYNNSKPMNRIFFDEHGHRHTQHIKYYHLMMTDDTMVCQQYNKIVQHVHNAIDRQPSPTASAPGVSTSSTTTTSVATFTSSPLTPLNVTTTMNPTASTNAPPRARSPIIKRNCRILPPASIPHIGPIQLPCVLSNSSPIETYDTPPTICITVPHEITKDSSTLCTTIEKHFKELGRAVFSQGNH